jgi:hypothetical protein
LPCRSTQAGMVIPAFPGIRPWKISLPQILSMILSSIGTKLGFVMLSDEVCADTSLDQASVAMDESAATRTCFSICRHTCRRCVALEQVIIAPLSQVATLTCAAQRKQGRRRRLSPPRALLACTQPASICAQVSQRHDTVGELRSATEAPGGLGPPQGEVRGEGERPEPGRITKPAAPARSRGRLCAGRRPCARCAPPARSRFAPCRRGVR